MTKITRNVRGGAGRTTLVDDLTATVPTDGGQFTVRNAAGWPSASFVVELDRGDNTKFEKILVASRTANVCTVATSGRGYDGTTARAHSGGSCVVEHLVDAAMLTALLEHVNTDAGGDHASYLKAANVGVLGDLSTVDPGDTALAGNSGKWARMDHDHPFTGTPAFSVRPTSVRSTSSGSTQAVLFDVADADTHSGFAASFPNNDYYTIPVGFGGLWLFAGTVEMVGNVTGYREAGPCTLALTNFTSWLVPAVLRGALNDAAVTDAVNFMTIAAVTAGQRIGMGILQNSGIGLNIGTTNTWFAGHFITNGT